MIIRFETALQSNDPFIELRKLALDLAAEGHTPQEVCDHFEVFRAHLRSSQRDEEEDIVMDVMDCIVGWCGESDKLFPFYNWGGGDHSGDA